MIRSVSFEKSEWNVLPWKFEAGTPNIAGVIGLGEAIDFLNDLSYEKIGLWEHNLLDYASKQISGIEGIKIIGTASGKTSVISFFADWAHPSDIGTLLDAKGIAIRTGHHCTQPLMERFKVPSTARASFAFYNTEEEIDIFISALKEARTMFV